MAKYTLHEWGIEFHSKSPGLPDGAPLLLGGRWFSPEQPWPQRYKTRREARAVAAEMTRARLYMRPAHVWTFRAVKLEITIRTAAP